MATQTPVGVIAPAFVTTVIVFTRKQDKLLITILYSLSLRHTCKCKYIFFLQPNLFSALFIIKHQPDSCTLSGDATEWLHL